MGKQQKSSLLEEVVEEAEREDLQRKLAAELSSNLYSAQKKQKKNVNAEEALDRGINNRGAEQEVDPSGRRQVV